jgi:hypothetical protein
MARVAPDSCRSYLRADEGGWIMAFSANDAAWTGRESVRSRLDRLDTLSRWLDIAFTLPGTRFRFGVEGVMRLVPGIGDAAASALSCIILYEAHRLGVPRRLMIRMAGNVAVEGIVGAVPVVGDLFDIAFRANRRNVQLLREHFGYEV